MVGTIFHGLLIVTEWSQIPEQKLHGTFIVIIFIQILLLVNLAIIMIQVFKGFKLLRAKYYPVFLTYIDSKVNAKDKRIQVKKE